MKYTKMDSQIKQKHLEFIKSYINSVTDTQKIDAKNILILTVKIMEVVKKFPNMTGTQKKELVQESIKNLIEQLNDDNDNKLSLDMILKNVIPNAIDILVDVSNGKHKFKLINKLFLCC